MKAFRRLDHLLCYVPDIREAHDLFHGRLGFPEAWPIGRFWPGSQACGLALGGINLELIQPDRDPPQIGMISALAFEPTDELQSALRSQGIPFEVFEKRESNPDLLRLRGLPDRHGPQLLCTNVIPEERSLMFPFFGCTYAPILRERLSPNRLTPAEGNRVMEIVIGHPDPEKLMDQLSTLGIEGGVAISATLSESLQVQSIRMASGPIDLEGWPAGFKFTA